MVFSRIENYLVFFPEDVSFNLWEEVIIALSDELMPWISHELTVGIIEKHPLVLAVFHKKRVRNGVDEAVQIVPRHLKL